MFKAAEGRNFHGALSAVHRRTVQEDFVLSYKFVVKIRKRISPFNSVEKFRSLQEIFSQQITQISDPSDEISFPFLSFIDRRRSFQSASAPIQPKRKQTRCFPQQADLPLGLGYVVGEEMVSATKSQADIEVFLDCYPTWRE
jgi:hypothetical protein